MSRWPALFALASALAFASRLPAQGSVGVSLPIAELEKRVKADSNDAAAHYNVALGYWSTKHWNDADRELRAAVALEPRFAAAHLALAYLPFARDPQMMRGLSRIDKDTPKSIRDAIDQRSREFARAFTIDPMVDMRIIAAATQSVNLNNPIYEEVFGPNITSLWQGYVDCQEGRYASCEDNIGIFMRSVRTGDHLKNELPTSALWYHGLAAAHQAHYDIAIADFTHLVNRDSATVAKAEEHEVVRVPIRTPQYRYFIGVFEQANGQAAEAVASYQRALEDDLSLYMAHVRLADIYVARKDWDHAIAERHNAVNANPDDPSLQTDLGVTLGLAGHFAEAHDALTAATDALPRNADAWYWAGIADEQLGEKAAAKAAFEHVIAVAPSRLQNRVAQAKQHLASLQ